MVNRAILNFLPSEGSFWNISKQVDRKFPSECINFSPMHLKLYDLQYSDVPIAMSIRNNNMWRFFSSHQLISESSLESNGHCSSFTVIMLRIDVACSTNISQSWNLPNWHSQTFEYHSLCHHLSSQHASTWCRKYYEQFFHVVAEHSP